MENKIETFLMYLAFGLLGIAFIILPFAIWDAITSEKITLIKKEWNCTETKTSVIFIYNAATKIILPQSTRICVNYKRLN